MPRQIAFTQMKNPHTGRWALIDPRTGLIVKTKVARWVDVPMVAYEPRERGPKVRSE